MLSSPAIESFDRPFAFKNNIFVCCRMNIRVIPNFTSLLSFSLCSVISSKGFGVFIVILPINSTNHSIIQDKQKVYANNK